MDPSKFIEFKNERDLGGILTDTFMFIRENWKEYFLTILKIVGPVLVVALALMVLFMFSMSDFFSDIDAFGPNPFEIISEMLSWIFGILFLYIMLYTLLSMSSLYFIKSYIKNSGRPDFNEVKADILQNIWKFIGLSILITIVTVFGAIFCYIPGIYLGTVLSLATSIMVFENKSIGDSFSHCFVLIKDQWWNTFGVLLVVWTLLMILGQAFSIPAIIYQFVKMGTAFGAKDPTQIFDIFKDPIYLILNIGSYVFQFILYAIPLISTVLIYFDLNEQKNFSGALEQIDKLGGDINDN